MGIFDQWSSVLPRHTKACRAVMPSIPLIIVISTIFCCKANSFPLVIAISTMIVSFFVVQHLEQPPK